MNAPTPDPAARMDALANHYAGIVLDNLSRPYPFASHHVETSPADRPSPRELHPAFYTSFDWHSCVHMTWLGVTLIEYGIDAGLDARLRAVLAANLTSENLAVEGAYLLANRSWERPYGWAWLVRLAATAAASEDGQLGKWGAALDPLVDMVAGLAADWTDKAEYPVRHGLHTNAAFGLGLMLDAFRTLGRDQAAAVCELAALRWFRRDTGWPGGWEMSGQDFLSPGLSEADLMARVLGPDSFTSWFDAFLPGLTPDARILAPYTVTDESDGYLAHLNGLNLTRAGQLLRISRALRRTSDGGATAAVLENALPPLLEAGLDAVMTDEFMSSHWLASFAWDALASARR
ncbi:MULTISPECIES: DUF2891 family protein [unclassified Arthrobacter]|uniref:DUF2891 family protein n=1 Tax=unclassified Arthrobacter TaxID=235627 RepID=UPI00159D1AFF|nr:MULTISPECIES: DUF2891 family protein [unclassified Arthrobacter]MCQ9164861.1 DUF2891 domain-containing protein [Arthrobacter sp. STN4]NVN00307.1 DUF2891 family protein [Arthrobacter sp. SDTb3-6]